MEMVSWSVMGKLSTISSQPSANELRRQLQTGPGRLLSCWLIADNYLPVRPLAQQEFAPLLDQGLAGICHDVGGGVGLAPQLRQVGAGADDVDRRAGHGHDAALGRREAGAGDDLDLAEAGVVEALAQAPDRRGGDAGADQVAQLRLRAISPDRLRRMALEHVIGAREVELLDIAPAMGVEAQRQPPALGELGEAPADRQRIRDLQPE